MLTTLHDDPSTAFHLRQPDRIVGRRAMWWLYKDRDVALEVSPIRDEKTWLAALWFREESHWRVFRREVVIDPEGWDDIGALLKEVAASAWRAIQLQGGDEREEGVRPWWWTRR